MCPITNLTRAAAMAGALFAASAIAQEVPRQVAQEAPPHTLKFPGGSLGEFVEALRKDSAIRGRHVNIVVHDTVESVTVPALELTGVSVRDALRAVGAVLMPVVRINVESFQDDADSMPIHAIQVFPISRQAAPPPPKMLKVLSLASLTHSDFLVDDGLAISAETALTAIETAIEIDGGPEVVIRFHQDSRLLFVRGTPDQTRIVETVIQQLERDLRDLEQRARAVRHDDRADAPAGELRKDTATDPVAPRVRRR